MKIAIADSNELDCKGLLSICHEVPFVDEVLVFTDFASLVKSPMRPDVLMMDFSTDGFCLEDVSRAVKKFPSAAIITITPLQPANTVLTAIKAGVKGYVKTDCSVLEIGDCIKAVYEGETFFCGDILRTLEAAGLNLDTMDINDLCCDPVLLTERETEILRYIATGHTNAEIAVILFLSGHTVTTHRKNIMAKIGAKNTAEAVLYAVKENVVDTDSFSFSKN